jgi:hypothetical protein
VPLNQQMACTSNANRANLARVNEIVCYRLDGSMNALVVAPNMTDLNASGGGSDDYWKLPKGNIDVTVNTSCGRERRDQPQRCVHRAHPAAEARRRAGRARAEPAPRRRLRRPRLLRRLRCRRPPAPAPSPTRPRRRRQRAVDEPHQRHGQWRLAQKTGGCSGCPDASAISEQQITGSGALEFVASEGATLRFVGLSSGGIGTGAGDLDLRVRLQSGVAEVREVGRLQDGAALRGGDTFRISVDGGGRDVREERRGVLHERQPGDVWRSRPRDLLRCERRSIQNVSIRSAARKLRAHRRPRRRRPRRVPQAGYAQPRPAGRSR